MVSSCFNVLLCVSRNKNGDVSKVDRKSTIYQELKSKLHHSEKYKNRKSREDVLSYEEFTEKLREEHLKFNKEEFKNKLFNELKMVRFITNIVDKLFFDSISP